MYEKTMTEIYQWESWVRDEKKSRFDIALLKIWIQFECYLGYMFTQYAVGNKSSSGFAPSRKLHFIDESHFYAFMRNPGQAFVDYMKKIETHSEHIFKSNPFDVIILDERRDIFLKIKAIRNYIAHESSSAKREVINKCFNGDERKFIEPERFLQEIPTGENESRFTKYIETLKEIIDLIEKPLGYECIQSQEESDSHYALTLRQNQPRIHRNLRQAAHRAHLLRRPRRRCFRRSGARRVSCLLQQSTW